MPASRRCWRSSTSRRLRRRPRRRRRLVRDRAGREVRDCRRIGLGQDDHRAVGAAAGRRRDDDGAIRLRATTCCEKRARDARHLRGSDIAMIFQEPMTALNPLYTVGKQIGEVLELHEALSAEAARAARDRAAARTGIPEPERRVDAYPAPALGRPAAARDDRDGARLPAEAPDRRRADDRARRDDPGADPGAARRPAARDRHGAPVHHARPEPGAALHAPRRRDGARPAGRAGATDEVFARPQHRTRGSSSRAVRSAWCSRCRPTRRCSSSAQDIDGRVRQHAGWFAKGDFHAVRDATLELRRGETLGIVGESGSGKTTLGMALAGAAADRRGQRRRSTARGSTAPIGRRCARCAGACRWCSRIRSRRSARA